MAYICTKPKGSCSKCPHYRFDEDYGNNACFAELDKKEKIKLSIKNKNNQKN